LVLVCKRYDLDPLLGHISLYDGKPYVHFAGYLHIANAHPQFAGIECLREWDDDTYFWATVRVHRGDRDFPAERTGKSRKQKRKKDGSTYTDDDADAKAFAQAARRALRMSFNIDHPDPAEDDNGPVAAPAPVVEVARRVEQTSDPAPQPPVRTAGSDPTSEAEAAGERKPGSRVAAVGNPSASDPNASEAGPRGNDATQAGREPPAAEAQTSPTSPGDDKAGRGRTGRRGSGNAPAAADPPPAAPDEQAEQAAFEQAQADDDAGRFRR
jgi:hypothetical protein